MPCRMMRRCLEYRIGPMTRPLVRGGYVNAMTHMYEPLYGIGGSHRQDSNRWMLSD